MFKKRETETLIEINGRSFAVKKVDALTGCYLASTMASKMLPAGIAGYTGIDTPTADKKMSKEEFKEFQLDILSCVTEK